MTAQLGFVVDELSTDPWCAIALDGAREKAWEHGFTISAAVTRGDLEMEQAVQAQMAAQPVQIEQPNPDDPLAAEKANRDAQRANMAAQQANRDAQRKMQAEMAEEEPASTSGWPVPTNTLMAPSSRRTTVVSW